MNVRPAAPPQATSFRPSALQRALFIGIGLSGVVFFSAVAETNSLAIAVFGIPAAVVTLEGSFGVTIDPSRPTAYDRIRRGTASVFS